MAGSRPNTPDSQRIVVLVHDDSLRRVVTLILEQLQLAVHSTSNVESAFQEMAERRPSLVICKQRRGLVDSQQVVERLRSNDAMVGVPVLLLTADTRMGPQRRFLAAGGTDVLQLPFSPDELQDTVLRMLAGSQRKG